MLTCVAQLKGVVKHNMMVEAENKIKSQELQNLSSDLGKKIETFEKEKSEAGDLNKLCEEELKLKRNEVAAKEKRWQRLAEVQRLCSEETDKKKDEWALVLEKIKESEKQFEMKSLELASKKKELGLVRESIEVSDSELELKKKDLELTLSKIEESGQQLADVNEQLDLKSKELEEIERELKLKRYLREMNTVFVKREKQPISVSSQQNDAEEETELIDTFTLHGISASLLRHEITSLLRDTPNPAEFVLERVQDGIRQGSSFQDTFLETLVLIFEELAKVQQLDEVAKTQGPDKSQLLQLQAAEVAALWKEKIAIKAPRSSLEALAFLMFIMAFGLKTLINEEEAALLAWSIAQYEQAPMLFEYLSISLTIRG